MAYDVDAKRIRCDWAKPRCRRSVSARAWDDAWPAADGWRRIGGYAVPDSWLCPIHGLELFGLIDGL